MLTPPPSKVWLAPECQTGKRLLLQKEPQGFINAQSLGSFLTFYTQEDKTHNSKISVFDSINCS